MVLIINCLVQQVGYFLPDLFLVTYAAGDIENPISAISFKFLAAYAAGHFQFS